MNQISPGPARVSPAIYTTFGVSHYNENPLSQALPPIIDKSSFIRRVTNRVEPTDSELQESSVIRMHCVNRLRSLIQPVPFYFPAWDAFDQMLRGGYVGRSFLRAAVQRHRYGTEDSNGHGESSRDVFKATSGAMCIVGLSGIGKSTLILRFLTRCYDQVIHHTNYEGQVVDETQVVWLYFTCPHDGSLGGFCKSFFTALDRTLGSNYVSTHANGSIPVQLGRMSQLCKTYHIGALVIDDLHHLSASKSGGEKLLLNFFDDVVNTVGVPLVLIGTYEARPFFTKTILRSRRVTGDGQHDFVRPKKGSEAWKFLVETVWEVQWFRSKAELTPKMIDLLYDLSQGITDILISLLVLAQRRAFRADREAISEKDLRAVSKNELALLGPALAALRSGAKNALKLYEDLRPTKEQMDLHIAAIELASTPSATETLAMLRRERAALAAGAETDDATGRSSASSDDEDAAAQAVMEQQRLAYEKIAEKDSYLTSLTARSVYDDLKRRLLIIDPETHFS